VRRWSVPSAVSLEFLAVDDCMSPLLYFLNAVSPVDLMTTKQLTTVGSSDQIDVWFNSDRADSRFVGNMSNICVPVHNL
jgi:hypothetical protein